MDHVVSSDFTIRLESGEVKFSHGDVVEIGVGETVLEDQLVVLDGCLYLVETDDKIKRKGKKKKKADPEDDLIPKPTDDDDEFSDEYSGEY